MSTTRTASPKRWSPACAATSTWPSRPHLGEALLVAVEEHSARCLVVDLGAVDYVDSSGIELLFRLHAALTAEGSDLIVVAPPGSNAARLLGLVAMSDIGEVRRTLAEALDRCAGRRETT